MDRVRGLAVSASLGLIATAEFNLGSGAWAKWKNVFFNFASRSSAGTKVEVAVRAQTNANGGCGTPHPFPPPPLTTTTTTLATNFKKTRRSRITMFEHADELVYDHDSAVVSTAKEEEEETAADDSSDAAACGTFFKNQTSLKGGHFANFKNVPDVGSCCTKCQQSPPCQFFTWTIGDGECYLNAKQGPLSHCPGACITGGLANPNPPPPPPPFPSPLQLSFTLGAPLPMGGDSGELLGSITLAGGTLVPYGGAESGVFAPTGSGPWCDFSGELTIPPSISGGGDDSASGHDLYVSMLATPGNHSLHRLALDYFSLRMIDA